jgi:hypothetical protein
LSGAQRRAKRLRETKLIILPFFPFFILHASIASADVFTKALTKFFL